ncbi:hypothetical protein IscW_ISCW024388, partial [Ixodes scapularis]
LVKKKKKLDSPIKFMTDNQTTSLLLRRQISRTLFLNAECYKTQALFHPNSQLLSSRKLCHTREYSLQPIFPKTSSIKNSFFPVLYQNGTFFRKLFLKSHNFKQALESYFTY